MKYPTCFKLVTDVYTLVFLTIALGIVIIAMSVNNRTYAQSMFDDTQSALPSSYSAKKIFTSGNILTDADVRNLLILIPEKNLTNSFFLPTDATVVKGTKVIWINSEQDTVHGIEIHDQMGKTLNSNSTIQFLNATSFIFDKGGVYRYSDPNNPTGVGTITVITKEKSPDNPSTNATMSTVGVFVAPKENKEYWDLELNESGFSIVDSYGFRNINLPTFADEAKLRILYVYTLKLDKESSIVANITTKLEALKQQLSGRSAISLLH